MHGALLLLKLGLVEVVLPALSWVGLLLLCALVLQLLVIRRLRPQLAQERGTARWLARLALLLLPAAAACFFGASFSLHRSAAALADAGSDRLVDLAIDAGDPVLAERLGIAPGDTVEVDLRAVRAAVRANRESPRLAEWTEGDGDGGGGAAHTPVMAIVYLPVMLEVSFWSALDRVLGEIEDRGSMPYSQLIAEVRARAKDQIRAHVADALRSAARMQLVLLAGAVGVIDGGVILVLWLRRRRRSRLTAAAGGPTR